MVAVAAAVAAAQEGRIRARNEGCVRNRGTSGPAAGKTTMGGWEVGVGIMTV